jgi:hypothetical protein
VLLLLLLLLLLPLPLLLLSMPLLRLLLVLVLLLLLVLLPLRLLSFSLSSRYRSIAPTAPTLLASISMWTQRNHSSSTPPKKLFKHAMLPRATGPVLSILRQLSRLKLE